MRKLFGHMIAVVAVLFLGQSACVLAEDAPVMNSISSVQSQQEGGRLLLKLQFKQALTSPPGNWSTVEPARIVFDFPETENLTGKNTEKINSGDLSSISFVQVDRLTRLVLNLNRSSGYSVSVDGNSLYIKLEPFSSDNSVPQVTPTVVKQVSKANSLHDPALLRDLSFRRGTDGQAKIQIDLSDDTVPLDIRRSGAGLTVDLGNTEIPPRLLSKRDVNDFATPVTSISTSSSGDHAIINIATKGRWIHQAQLVNNQLQIEIKQLTQDEANKLVPIGHEGKKISVNFYDAELSMVLRTLAELSNRNVIVDPSLNGKKITITLDNMPYDEALELVMIQTGAAMRVKPNLVLFATRELLLKRDAESAEELSRANETAPLVVETFQLNYVPAGEIIKLVMLAQSETSSLTPTATTVTTTQPGGGASSSVAQLPRGILSPRGSISNHAVSNKLFVRDTQAVIDQIRSLIKELDVPPKQVLVEARIVEVATEFARNLGVRLSLFNSTTFKIGGGVNVAMGTPTTTPNVNIFGGTVTPVLDTTSATTTSISKAFGTSFSAFDTTSSLNLMLFNNAATKIISLELDATESDKNGKTVSSPRVVTQNRKAANIIYLQQYALYDGINPQTGMTIWKIIDAPLSLDVTPSITPDNRVNLELKILKSSIVIGQQGAYTLDKNTLNTNVMVENGGTVVIGGFYIEKNESYQERVPFLGELPYVGFLFKATQTSRKKNELLVFITPRVISDHMALH